MNQPNLLSIPFAKNAGASTKNEIPDSPGPTLAPQQATWEEGFPLVTMQPPTIGGIPPQGGDFNGVLNALSEHTVYQNAGGMYKFNAELAAAIGGYSKGAVLISDDGATLYRSLVDNNLVNPNVSGVGAEWANAAADDSLRQDLANPSEGAALVAFVQDGEGAIAMPMLQKARQFLHGEDFGFMPDSGDVTEEGMRLFHTARVEKKKVYLAGGVHTTSGALDPGGIFIEGVKGGYRNNAGTIISGDGSHHIFEQLSNATSRITYGISGVHGTNALSLLKAGYAAFCRFEHISASQVDRGIILTDPTVYGNLWNMFIQMNIVAREEAFLVDGATVANANILNTCYLSGGTAPLSVEDYTPAARITASGGYGAIANLFINTEIRGPGVGLEVRRSVQTHLLGGYHESDACSVAITGGGEAKDNRGHIRICEE